MSASRYSTSVSASGGGNGVSGGGGATTDEAMVVAVEDSDAAGWVSLPHAATHSDSDSAAATTARAVGRRRAIGRINLRPSPPEAVLRPTDFDTIQP